MSRKDVTLESGHSDVPDFLLNGGTLTVNNFGEETRCDHFGFFSSEGVER